jgi:hypothetical protein
MPHFSALVSQGINDGEPALRTISPLLERGNALGKGLVGRIEKAAEGGISTALKFSPGRTVTEEQPVNMVFPFSAPDGKSQRFP